MKKLLVVMLLSFSAVAVLSRSSLAQLTSDEGIHGMGEVVLERNPELMRLQVNLLAKGKDLPEAITKLKARRTKVEKQLETLGAAKDSVKFGDVELDTAQDDQQRQMEMMLRQRMAQRRGGKRPAEKEVSVKPVKVLQTLKAEWLLKAANTTDLLVLSKKLQDAIKAADLGGLKDAEEPTPEEAELAEESEEMGMHFGGQEGPKPGEPVFVFVAKINSADREKALAEAFRAAKQEAAQLAKAADLELGALRSLQGGGGIDAEDGADYRLLYNTPFGAAMRQQMTGRNHSGEAIGASPGVLKFKVTVNATFGLK